MTMGFLLINMLLLAGCYCTSIWDTAVGVPNWSWWSAFAGDRSTQCESDDIKVAQHPFLFSSLAFHSQNLQVPFCSEVVAPSPSPHPRYLQGAGGSFNSTCELSFVLCFPLQEPEFGMAVDALHMEMPAVITAHILGIWGPHRDRRLASARRHWWASGMEPSWVKRGTFKEVSLVLPGEKLPFQ